MSIATEIQRIKTSKTNLVTDLNNAGIEIPSTALIDDVVTIINEDVLPYIDKRYDTLLNIDLSDVSLGDTIVVTVSCPDNATGNINLRIGGFYNETYQIKGGKVVFEVDTILDGDIVISPTEYLVIATYEGDSNYKPNFSVVTVNITSDVILSRDVYVDEDSVSFRFYVDPIPMDGSTSSISMSGLSNDNIINVDVDGVPYSLNISNGVAGFFKPELEGGGHVWSAVLVSKNYCSNYISGSFYISDVTSSVSADVVNGTRSLEDYNAFNLDTGDTIAYITVNVPIDATGVIDVTYGSAIYRRSISNGYCALLLPNLSIGSNTITISYNGDYKYAPSFETIYINVTV